MNLTNTKLGNLRERERERGGRILRIAIAKSKSISHHPMSESCHSRHFSWLMKSCFPNPQHHHPQPLHRPISHLHHTTISSLPDDLLLECLSRVSSSSLPSVSLVCRRWSRLLSSSALYDLRRRNASIFHTVFVFSVTDSGLFAATLRFGHAYSWRTNFIPAGDCGEGFRGPLSHSRISAIGRGIYIIGRREMVRYDAWTGAVTARAGMVFPRKKFAAAMVAGRIYVAGGAARTSALEEYDPVSDKWTVVAEAPRRRYGCVGAAVDGVVYVIGGLKIGASETEVVPLAAGADAHVYASSMDLYDVEARGWLRSRAVPSGGCVVAACAAAGFVYILTSHAVELSFWRFDARRKATCGGGGGFGEWRRMKSPPLPAQVRLDSSVRFSCVGVGDAVALIQVTGCIDDLLRRSGRSARGLKGGLVLIYDAAVGEWSRGADLPEVIRRAACVSLEC